MDEGRALLAAVIAHPDDDTPRLVYADWLQEHDQPERAEFIRVQVELCRLTLGSPASDKRYRELSDRERELLGAHGRRWQQEFAATLVRNRLTDFWFRRGLVGTVLCTTKYFMENAGGLVASAPLESLTLRRPTPRAMREVASAPDFKRFSTFNLDADSVNPLVIQSLLNSEPRHLRRLAVTSAVGYATPPHDWANRNAEVVERIAASGSLSGLDLLDLRMAGVGERGATALATSAALARLRVLLLTGNAFAEPTGRLLRERFGQRVYLDYTDYRGRLTIGDLI